MAQGRAIVHVMPLTLDERTVSRLDDRALHKQLADRIRAAINEGQLAPGESLPAEAVIATATGLSVTAVRDALALLVTDGLIVKQSGKPSRVATPAPVRHMATSRYADELKLLRSLRPDELHPETSAFVKDHGIEWSGYSVQADYQEDTATPEEVRRLALDTGAAVLRRQLVKVVHDTPVQLQESVIPLELVKDTPVADPTRQPWPGGTIAELWSIGLVVAHVLEEARARTPTAAERRTLEMAAPGPVFDIVRVFSTAERPVEASAVVCPAAGVKLSWDTSLVGIDL